MMLWRSSGVRLRFPARSANTFVLLKMPPKAKDGTQPPQLDTRCLRIARDSSRIAVTGNSFCDSYIGEGALKRKVDDQLAGGIVLEATRDVAISGNVFSCVPKALELRGPKSQHLLFSNNLLADAPSDQLAVLRAKIKNSYQLGRCKSHKRLSVQ